MTPRIDPALIPDKPDLNYENALWNAGAAVVAGIDEAGRGCLAGPVYAAAVILPNSTSTADQYQDVQDSKIITPELRNTLRELIEEKSQSWGVGKATNTEIDQYGILPATRLAVSRALEKLMNSPDHLLVDYITLPDNPLPQTRLAKGDARSLSIAAASILAKTHRDEFMTRVAKTYPEYGFDRNKGYGTAFHREVIERLGPCSLHRMSFAPFRQDLDQELSLQLDLDL